MKWLARLIVAAFYIWVLGIVILGVIYGQSCKKPPKTVPVRILKPNESYQWSNK